MKDSENTEKWFCSECTSLLGIKQNDEIVIRYKLEINLTVKGEVKMVCRRCGTINQMTTQLPVSWTENNLTPVHERRKTPGSKYAGRSLLRNLNPMPEVKIRYRKMTDKEFDAVAEAMADMIICYIQDRKNREGKGQSDKKLKRQSQERSNGNVQPV